MPAQKLLTLYNSRHPQRHVDTRLFDDPLIQSAVANSNLVKIYLVRARWCLGNARFLSDIPPIEFCAAGLLLREALSLEFIFERFVAESSTFVFCSAECRLPMLDVFVADENSILELQPLLCSKAESKSQLRSKFHSAPTSEIFVRSGPIGFCVSF